jgi:hypothetical protein
MILESFSLQLFLVNIILVLLDAAFGYHLIPHLMARAGDPETASAGVRASRGLLPVIVALYMFFNCLGYFQARPNILITVTCLVLIDLALQIWLRRGKTGSDQGNENEDDQ